MRQFNEVRTAGELKALLQNIPDDLPVNLQQLKQMNSL